MKLHAVVDFHYIQTIENGPVVYFPLYVNHEIARSGSFSLYVNNEIARQ